MKLLKQLCVCFLLIILTGLWGCSGDNSTATGTAANKTKPSGKSLVDDLQITSEAGVKLDQGQPSVAYDIDNNRYMVVWQHLTATGGYEIRGRLYSGSGTGTTTAMTPFTAEFVINDSGAVGTRQQPKVAYCNDPSNPRFLVVWSDSRNGYGQIYGHHFSAAGTAILTDFPISNHSAANTNQIEPEIIYNQVSRRFIVAWVDTTTYDSTANAANQLVVQGASCSNFTLVPYIPLPSVDNYLIRSTEVNPANGTTANTRNWSGLLSNGDPVYTETVTDGSYTTSWTAFSDETKPKLVVSSTDGTYYAAWSGRNYNVKLDGKYIRLNETSSESRTGGGTFAVNDIQVISRPGKVVSAATIFLEDGTTAATGAIISGLNSSTLNVRIAAGSNLIGQPAMVVKLIFSIGDCEYKFPVTWTAAAKSDQFITTTKNDGLGLVKYFTFGTAGSTSPGISVDPNTNRMLLVWEDLTQVIKGQLIDLATFNNYGSTIDITTTKATAPVVSFDNANQRFLVVWEDARNQSANISNMDIYSQFIDPQGQLSGGNSLVTVAPGNQLAPAVAFGGVNFRQFMVVWKDGRAASAVPPSGDSDIWGQTIEFSQSPQLVIADSTGNPILNGSIDFGNVALGQTKDISLKLRNDGNTQLTINQDPLKTILPDKPYTLLNTLPVTISPGTSYDLTIRFTPTAVGSYAGTSSNRFKLQIDSNGGQSVTYFNGSGTGTNPLAITTSVLPDGTPNFAYYAALTGFGGAYPYRAWSEPAGVLASLGLSLNSATGVISGFIPALAEKKDYPVTFRLEDNAGTIVDKPLILRVSGISITTTTLSEAVNNIFYSQAIATQGGIPGLTWSITAGTLPPGLLIGATTGVISGIPTASGSFTFTVSVTDSTAATSAKQFTIQIQQDVLSIATASFSAMKTNSPVNVILQGAGGVRPYRWSLTSGAFPTGSIVLDANGGNIAGTPTVAGDYTFEITLTDKLGAIAKKTYTVPVRDNLNITTSSLKSWATGQPGYVDTLTATGGRGTYTWSIPSGTLPTGLTLNGTTGVISGTPTVAGTYSVTIQVTDSGELVETVTKQFNITISSAMVISTASLPVTTKSAPYLAALESSGGTPTIHWSSTQLPAGLTLNVNSGVVSGSATEAGLYSVVFTVTDGSGASASKTFVIDVRPALQITTTTLKPWTQGVGGYVENLTKTGGLGPYKWEWGVGTSPAPVGLVLNSTSGAITGAPSNTYSNGYTILLRLTDANGAVTTASINNFVVNPPMSISPSLSLLSPATPGIVYQGMIALTGGTAPYIWSVQSGTLPTGLTIDPNSGIISGIPTAAGTSNFSVQATDASGATIIQSLHITVADPLVISSSATLPSVALQASYSNTLTATGGKAPYTWSVTTGTLPIGLSLAPATGLISGIATAPGKYDFDVQLADSGSRTITKTLSITVGGTGSVSVATTALPGGEVNIAYTYTLSGTGGTRPYTWSLVNNSSLPPGIALDTVTGVISGKPTVGGRYDLIIQVTDANDSSATQGLSLVILDPNITGGTVQFTDGTNQITSLDFGNTYRGAPNKRTVTIRNTSDVAVLITSVVSSNSPFTVPGAPFTVPANGTRALDLTFTPTQIAFYEGIYTLTDSSGSTYPLSVKGAGIAINVEVKPGQGTVSYFNSLAATALPTKNKPSDFRPISVAEFQLKNIVPASTVTVSITYANMPPSPIFYALDANKTWVPLAGRTLVAGNVVTFDIIDNQLFDTDPSAGIFYGTVIVGAKTSGIETINAPPPASVSGGGGGSGCFIATAAYGSYLDPHVMVLRHFRDDVLLQSKAGSAFVAFYYRHSPAIADFIAQHDSLRLLMRLALTPLIVLVKFGWFGLAGGTLLAGFGAARVYRRRSRTLQLNTTKLTGDCL